MPKTTTLCGHDLEIKTMFGTFVASKSKIIQAKIGLLEATLCVGGPWRDYIFGF